MQYLRIRPATILGALLLAAAVMAPSAAAAAPASREALRHPSLRRAQAAQPRRRPPVRQRPRRLLPRQLQEGTPTASATSTETATPTASETPQTPGSTATATQTPTPTATAPFCGDGVVGPGEECETDADCGTEPPCFVCQCTHGPFAGPVRITLRWTNHNDVDLSVIDPAGQLLVPFFDANADCRYTTRKPEESVFVPRSLVGCYTLVARHRQRCRRSGIVDTHLDIRTSIEGVKGTIHDVPGPEPGQAFVALLGVRAACPR